MHVLADFLKSEALKNDAINAMIEKHTEAGRYPWYLATYVYSSTVPASPLRRLIVDFHIWRGKGSGLKDSPDRGGPKEFFQDVANAILAAGAEIWAETRQVPYLTDSCAYHEHADGVRCDTGT